MYYVYRKSDGSILSASQSTPIVEADESNGIVNLPRALPIKKWASYRIVKGQLKRAPREPARNARLRRERRIKALAEAKIRFWEIVDDAEADANDLREALRIVGRYTFPRGRPGEGV